MSPSVSRPVAGTSGILASDPASDPDPVSASVPSASGGLGSGTPQTVTGPGGSAGGQVLGAAPAAGHATISVPMSASVTIGAIVLAVLLAVAGGLLAGSFGGWRAARLRPAAALARVA